MRKNEGHDAGVDENPRENDHQEDGKKRTGAAQLPQSGGQQKSLSCRTRYEIDKSLYWYSRAAPEPPNPSKAPQTHQKRCPAVRPWIA